CLLSLRRGQRPRPTSFPYTTLFRSRPPASASPSSASRNRVSKTASAEPPPPESRAPDASAKRTNMPTHAASSLAPLLQCTIATRSEEHTSELQSRENLVCRLLLETK